MTTTDVRDQMYTVNEGGTVYMNRRPFDKRLAQRNTRYLQIYSYTRVYDDTGEIEIVKETSAPEPAHM